MIPAVAPLVGQSIRVKTLAPFACEWFSLAASTVSDVNGKTGSVTLTHTDISDWNTALASYAPLANPALTGTPTGPTAAPGTNTTQLATTAFVTGAVVASTSGVASLHTRTGAVALTFLDVSTAFPAASALPLMDGTAALGSSNGWARGDHVHPSDTSKLAVSAASATLPLMNSAANAGTSANWSRGDHVHPSDTAKLSLSGGTMTGPLTLAADPAAALQPVTKQYADNLILDCGVY